MPLRIQDTTRRFMAVASIGVNATLLGLRLGILESRAAFLKKDDAWLRKNASESQSFWTNLTFRAVRACAELRLDWKIEEHDATHLVRGPVLIISNHQGALDIPAIAWFMAIWGRHDIRWVVKQDIRRWPFIGRSCLKSGCSFVTRDPNKMKRDLKTVVASARMAHEESASFIIFPEGTRFKNPDPKSEYEHVLPPSRAIVSQLLKALPDYPVCSLTLCQYPRNVPSREQTLYIRARVAHAKDVRSDVRAWLRAEWDAKEAFIASLQSPSEAPSP